MSGDSVKEIGIGIAEVVAAICLGYAARSVAVGMGVAFGIHAVVLSLERVVDAINRKNG